MSQPPILIILVAGIGDMILASKAMRSIRRGYPQSEIHLLTSTEAGSLAQSFPYINRIYFFPIRS